MLSLQTLVWLKKWQNSTVQNFGRETKTEKATTRLPFLSLVTMMSILHVLYLSGHIVPICVLPKLANKARFTRVHAARGWTTLLHARAFLFTR